MDWYSVASEAIDKETALLKTISLNIHARPELAYEEKFAHDELCSYLESQKFTVTRHYKIPTAFRASAGKGSPVIGIMCEYDALPGIGHACGHNLIAVSALAIGVGIKTFLERSGKEGTVVVFGTPAEESEGGKCDLLAAGAYDDVDLAMMCHPRSTYDHVYVSSLAMHELFIEYLGRNAHAAAAPWEGVNALDALVSAYNSISCLRQQIRLTDRVHGVITNGGTKPNIIPDKTCAHYFVRAKDRTDLENLKERVMNCFRGAELSSGCKMNHNWAKYPFLDVATNDVMAARYTKNLASLGIALPSKEDQLSFTFGSTDMGNISYILPSIHPAYAIPTDAGNHTPEFTAATCTDQAHECTWRASKALAWTAIDFYCDPWLVQNAKDEFKRVHHKS
eukprot:TRINITY_DN7099_c0_g1_i1.p1 TRINITY_DN7099_c0_g1~~TRINITY_DN7099_c0_g1_i1.p1  ORF type:complete len:401 (-),score=41.89 TRINITY_DN7099_c0_g1_i1:24-1205(-)